MQNIYIAPLKVSDNDFISCIRVELQNIFGVNVETINLYLELKSSYSPDRNQYYSTEIISRAIPLTAHLDGLIILIAEFDLYIPVLTYVFGEAQFNGKNSIVSLCRLHEEFYTGKTDDNLLLKRTLKEILHEIGHNLGLKHCSNWECVMHSSTSIEEVDVKGSYYCQCCSKKIDI